MRADVLEGGFAQAPLDSARSFRVAMNALARPGRIGVLTGARPPAPLSVAAGVLLLTLVDGSTPVWLAPSHDLPDVRDWLVFHTGAALVAPEAAMFALGRWEALLPLDRFPLGTPDYPDRSATLIIECDALRAEGCRLTGPGIKGEARLSLPDPAAFAANHARYPLGFDAFLTAGALVAGLPRSTRVEAI
ncbi:phosphonate C-P lyase system protein PhnH [Paracoccaceae bacterium Fryx2]|nr:phosphonate C-P lyase system protein PhnH [Paracoccaceae bacterium Fryx2]